MEFFAWLYVALAVVVLFGASVFVHEFGHFLMARRRGLKVDGFSIGFGPRLLGWRRDGVDYAWRLIPAGGFVALPQMAGSETIEGRAQANERLAPASPGSKILVALAGPVMNGVFAFVLATAIYFLGLPVRVNPAIVGGVKPGSAEAKLGIRPGDRIVAVNGKPVASWEDVGMTVAMAPTNDLPVTIERDGVRSTFWLSAKPNPQLGLKMLDLEPSDHPVVKELVKGDPAEKAGLKPGDEILSFNAVPVMGQEQLVTLIRARAEKPSRIEIKRGNQHLALLVTPKRDPKTGAGAVGVMIGSNDLAVYQIQRPGPAPWQLVAQVTERTFQTIGALLHPKLSGVGVQDLSGPPGILAMLAVEVKTDYRLALEFMVLLNVSLALLNLLPLPVLDGGHIAMAIVEKLRGRPLSQRFQEYITTTFAMLLISFMLYVSYNDIVRRFPLFKSMFDEQVQIQSPISPSNAPPASEPAGR